MTRFGPKLELMEYNIFGNAMDVGDGDDGFSSLCYIYIGVLRSRHC